MKDEASLRNEINLTLEKEGLQYEGDIGPKHLLQVLYDDIGVETIKDMVVNAFDGLKIATHYGCHLLRPREVVQF
jgi:heterodisulfide reductase subunit B